MWWSSNYIKGADKQAAQDFHYDMDRIKWLKFFIYLTDVDENNGPHCFIKGSHRSGNIPDSLLSIGYARLSDEDVANYYSPDKYLYHKGTVGTIVAEDSRGLHKGHPLKYGERLVFQVQFSISEFGSSYRAPKIKNIKSESFLKSSGIFKKTLKSFYTEKNANN
jgi:ectoine hydroxylase-related dioxygenase (phytanoyl-CoA dioxygenase family)